MTGVFSTCISTQPSLWCPPSFLFNLVLTSNALLFCPNAEDVVTTHLTIGCTSGQWEWNFGNATHVEKCAKSYRRWSLEGLGMVQGICGKYGCKLYCYQFWYVSSCRCGLFLQGYCILKDLGLLQLNQWYHWIFAYIVTLESQVLYSHSEIARNHPDGQISSWMYLDVPGSY